MKEILFRGKSLDTRKWVYGGYHACESNTVILHKQGINLSHQTEVNPDSVCQFTGLNDRKGDKIFEHDIVTLVDTESEYVDVGIGPGMKVAEQGVCIIGRVLFHNGGFGVFVKDNSELWNKGFNSFHNNDHVGLNYDMSELQKVITIIGNEIDNPELVE